jgi:hypothetical protein
VSNLTADDFLCHFRDVYSEGQGNDICHADTDGPTVDDPDLDGPITLEEVERVTL